jgi:hypothetical protein
LNSLMDLRPFMALMTSIVMVSGRYDFSRDVANMQRFSPVEGTKRPCPLKGAGPEITGSKGRR